MGKLVGRITSEYVGRVTDQHNDRVTSKHVGQNSDEQISKDRYEHLSNSLWSFNKYNGSSTLVWKLFSKHSFSVVDLNCLSECQPHKIVKHTQIVSVCFTVLWGWRLKVSNVILGVLFCGTNLAPMNLCFITYQIKEMDIFFSDWGISLKLVQY